MLNKQQTSNPIFSNSFWKDGKKIDHKMTIQGTLLKSSFCFFIMACVIGLIWEYASDGKYLKWWSISGLVLTLGIGFILHLKQHLAPILVPLYTVTQGAFLSTIIIAIHNHYPLYPLRALGITILTGFIMLICYGFQIIKLTQKLRSVIITSAFTIMIIYLITWILSFFGIHNTLIWGDNWFAIGFNIFAVVTSAFSLLLDFDFIKSHVNRAAKNKEWMAALGLQVTLVWLYIELLRLFKRFANK